jgi:hypothetical protein
MRQLDGSQLATFAVSVEGLFQERFSVAEVPVTSEMPEGSMFL